jgi:hypothetical protein
MRFHGSSLDTLVLWVDTYDLQLDPDRGVAYIPFYFGPLDYCRVDAGKILGPMLHHLRL